MKILNEPHRTTLSLLISFHQKLEKVSCLEVVLDFIRLCINSNGYNLLLS